MRRRTFLATAPLAAAGTLVAAQNAPGDKPVTLPKFNPSLTSASSAPTSTPATVPPAPASPPAPPHSAVTEPLAQRIL